MRSEKRKAEDIRRERDYVLRKKEKEMELDRINSVKADLMQKKLSRRIGKVSDG